MARHQNTRKTNSGYSVQTYLGVGGELEHQTQPPKAKRVEKRRKQSKQAAKSRKRNRG